MAFVCRATWTVKEGSLDIVLDALKQVSPPSREEPGVRYYQSYRDPAAPNVVRLFEVYDDEAAFKAHGETEHFQKWVIGTVVPVLDNRIREFYETIDA
jgi:quinol monooxygenase YgiN